MKTKDGTEYQGGETRLMQLTQHATHADVLEALDRCAGPGGANITSAGSASSTGSVRGRPHPVRQSQRSCPRHEQWTQTLLDLLGCCLNVCVIPQTCPTVYMPWVSCYHMSSCAFSCTISDCDAAYWAGASTQVSAPQLAGGVRGRGRRRGRGPHDRRVAGGCRRGRLEPAPSHLRAGGSRVQILLVIKHACLME